MTPPPALAYWLSAEALTAVRAVALRAASAADAPAALRAAVLELDAAAVRSRWFDHPAGESFRRVAGHDPDAVALRLTDAEHAALLACNPELVGPLLEDDTRRARPTAVAATAQPSIRPAGPVVILDFDGINLTWAVAEFDGVTVHVGRPSPGAGIWTRACEETRVELVDVEIIDSARRFVARAHPALSSLALARPDCRPHPGEAVLLRLPDTVVVARADVSARIVLYAAPTQVLSVAAEALPAEPSPASTVR